MIDCFRVLGEGFGGDGVVRLDVVFGRITAGVNLATEGVAKG